jgi:hypothetical protein
MSQEIKDAIARRALVTLIVSAIAIPLSIAAFVSYFILKSYAKANIRVDTAAPIHVLNENWRGFAQGGEEVGVRMLDPVVPHLSALAPRYIRIDHIYDFYDVVHRVDGGGLSFDWRHLDATVCDIYETGARPFFALGYMPKALSDSGSPIDPPRDWNEWRQVVQATIERYSGRQSVLCDGQVTGDRLSETYYEVWNEPDLEQFGKWSIYGGAKSYLTMYHHAAKAAASAADTHHFSLGGPATTAPYKNWMRTFVDYAKRNSLRLDFLSWHKYTDNPQDYARDLRDVDSWLTADAYPSYYNVQRVISEWGIDSQSSDVYNGRRAAAHAAATVTEFAKGGLDLALAFEPVDGPQSMFGLIDREGRVKPRYSAFRLLNSVAGNHVLSVSGETEHVRILGTKNPQTGAIVLVISNYDRSDRHEEEVPITLGNLAPGTYEMHISTLGIPRRKTDSITIVGGEDVARSIYMLPNDVAVIEITPQ